MLTEVSSRGGGRRANTRLERKDLAAVGPRSREPPHTPRQSVVAGPGQVGRTPSSACRDDLDGQIRHMLFSWAERQAGQPGAVGLLVQALEQSDRQDVAEEVRAVLELGCRKYQDGIRRTGLAPKDPALPGSSAPQPPEPAQA